MKVLIERIKTNDLAAMEELYQQVKPMGIKIATTYVGEDGLEEDMFHEAFIKAINNLDKYDVERPFQPWFDVILANTCKSYLRKKRTENIQNVTSEEGKQDISEEISPMGNPEECWEQKELSEILKCMMEGLSREQKEAVVLFYYQCLSVAEIAKKQNCGEDTVKSRLHQSRSKLKGAIEAYEKKQNVKLHSIGVVVALYVFFKSDMGKSLACGYDTGTSALAEGAVTQSEGKAAKALTKDVTGEGSGEIAAAASEMVKAATMGLGTKIAIGIGVVFFAGALGVGALLLDKEKEPTISPQPISVVQVTQSPEESTELTEEPSLTAIPELTEEPVEERIIPDGITVHEIENGIKKLSADLSKISFSSANGGTVITYTEAGCGAVDYDGYLLLENSYKYYYGAPDEMGNFMLGDDDTIDVFNKDGEKVHTVENWYYCRLAEGYVAYTVQDWGTGVLEVNCYDIANNKLSTYTIQDVGGFIYSGAVAGGKFYVYCWEGEKTMLYNFATDATVIDAVEFLGKPVYGSPNGGYLYCNYSDMSNSEELCSLDGTERYPLNFINGYGYKCSFLQNNVSYYNKGKKIVYRNEEGNMHYLLDFENYSESAGTEACVVAQYPYICLSSAGICYAEDDAGNFYMLEDGTRVEDDYIDRSLFADKYAAVLDANGKACLIDANMNILTQEEIAAHTVYLRGAMPVAEDESKQTIFLTE